MRRVGAFLDHSRFCNFSMCCISLTWETASFETRERNTVTEFTIYSDDKARLKQLVIDAQAGDRDAFGELFERYHRTVLTIATRRLGGDTAEAQELCQDVFIQAMQKLQQLRTPECFGGWLKSITHRMAINRLVRKGPWIATEPCTMEATCVEFNTPLGSALVREREEQVRAGLGRLRDLDRETLEAFYIRGCSLREMSDQFNAPLGTIKRRLHMARKRLSREVEELIAV